MTTSEMTKFDLVVVGSGFSGLAATKTYVELHPTATVVIIDDAKTLGGVWAEQRLYPGLKTNNMLGTYEFSDFPMDESYGVKAGQHIPGAVVHRYLKNYATHFGLTQRLRLNTKVNSAERKPEQGWLLTTEEHGQRSSVLAEKLIVATGLTSEPFMPDLPIRDDFEPPVFHCKDFRKNADSLKNATSVTVYGGNKSAFDVAYSYATAGVQVDMVVRESGHGPAWMSPPYVTPLHRWLEKLLHTRFLTWFSPCIWGPADGFAGIRSFYHGTALGRMIVDTFWGILGGDVQGLNGYDKHPETKKLKPWSKAFFIGAGLGILNYDTNWFDLVRDGKVKVHIADITSCSGRNIQLSNGKTLTTNALVLSTGWRVEPPIKFLPKGIDSKVGIPHYSKETVAGVDKADQEILRLFPKLKNPPNPNPNVKQPVPDPEKSLYKTLPNQPYRLYRFMVPPAFFQDRNIGFAGAMMSVSTTMVAQTQALWLSAYFDGKLNPQADIMEETILHSQFGKWRSPAGHGARFPDFVFDALPYLDLMLSELGLRVHRKGGKTAEWFSPYGPEDYRGLIDEWIQTQKKQKEKIV